MGVLLRRLALAGLLLLAAAGAHAATGINLRWNACLGDGGTINRNFACNTNSGADILVASFVVPEVVPAVENLVMTLDLAFATPHVPSWWALVSPGSCRQSSLNANATLSPAAVNCTDWSAGFAIAGVGSYINPYLFGPNTTRTSVMCATTVPLDIPANTEMFAANLAINHQKTVGALACEGCTVPACIVLRDVTLNRDRPGEYVVAGPANFTDSFYVTWQGGADINTGLGSGCPRAVPVRRESWGAVKALYR